MSARETAFKIRDKETGLYWAGPTKGMICPVGTRFHSLDMMRDALRGHRGEIPDTWEFLEVKIVEEPLHTLDPFSVKYAVHKHEFVAFYSTFRDALVRLVNMETKWEFFIPIKRTVCRDHELWNRRAVIRKFLESKELHPDDFIVFPANAAIACNEVTATMMRLHDLAEHVIDVQQEIDLFVTKTGIPASYIK